MNNIISLNELLVIYNLPSHLVVVLTLKGNIEYLNNSVGTLLGYWEENLLGNHFSSIIHPDDTPEDVVDFYKMDGTTYTHNGIKRVRTSEGTYRFFSWSFTKPADSKYVYGIAQDCTDKMELEEIFRFSSLKQDSKRGITIIDQNKKLLWSNDSFERITGYTRKELVNKNLFNMLSGPLTTADNKAFIQQKIDAGLAFSNEGVYYHKQGRPLWMRIDAQPLFDNNTGKPKWFLVHSDMTVEIRKDNIPVEAKSADQSFPGKEDARIVTDTATGKIILVNQQAIDTYQYSSEEFGSLFFKDLFPGFEPFTVSFDGLPFDDAINVRESYHKKKNGEIIKVRSTYTSGTHNGIPVLISTHKDLTVTSSTQIFMDKRDCLRNIAWKQSHLMRSPLANLKSLLVFLMDDPGNTEFMNYMQTELERLDKVIKEMVYETSISVALQEHAEVAN
jgi:PAS domain S-box-containing protein